MSPRDDLFNYTLEIDAKKLKSTKFIKRGIGLLRSLKDSKGTHNNQIDLCISELRAAAVKLVAREFEVAEKTTIVENVQNQLTQLYYSL
jgi:hypothetical protein